MTCPNYKRVLPGAIFLLLFCASLLGCSSQPSDNADQSVEQRAWTAIREGALLVDLRSAQQFESGHVSGAVNIPFGEIVTRAKELGEDKSRKIVLYCADGNHSREALVLLKTFGYKDAIVAGGYESLKRAE